MTGVTNPATRHPAALATVAATVQEESGGRVDPRHRPRRHRAVPPRAAADAGRRLLRALRGAPHVPQRRHGRHRRATRAACAGSTAARQPPVPIDIAASGPKVIAFAARTVERITFAVGADPERLAWAIDLARAAMRRRRARADDVSFGAYVTVALPSRPGAGTRPRAGQRRRVRTLLGDAGLDRRRTRRARPGARRRGRAYLRQQLAPREQRRRTRRCCPTSSSTGSRSSATSTSARDAAARARRARARARRRHRPVVRRRPRAAGVHHRLVTDELLPALRSRT